MIMTPNPAAGPVLQRRKLMGSARRILLCSILSLFATAGCRSPARKVGAAEFLQLAENRKPLESVTFWRGSDGYAYLDCHHMDPLKIRPVRFWVVRTPMSELTESQLLTLERRGLRVRTERPAFSPSE